MDEIDGIKAVLKEECGMRDERQAAFHPAFIAAAFRISSHSCLIPRWLSC
jgi:hypothetical protein